MINVFIDGSAGTTGLRIYDRLKGRNDLRLITLAGDLRKDPAARKEAMNASEIVFLCLPDDAAREAVTLVENPSTVVIDTSTAHRTADGWIYGFPELSGQKEKIRTSKRIANPGCHASGFISLIAPLTEAGVIEPEDALSCFSLTGYSGGGKKMIADYEAKNRAVRFDSGKVGAVSEKNSGLHPECAYLLSAPRMYGISQTHKHLPEMLKLCGLKKAPVFCPIVGDYYSGMEVVVSLFDKDIEKIRDVYRSYYAASGLVRFAEDADETGFLSAAAFSGRDDMQISVQGNDERILLVSRFDNLGKGASGAAIQNMNLVLGLPEETGLVCCQDKQAEI